ADGYHFVNWTGDTANVADVNAASTTITMHGNYTVLANCAAAVAIDPASKSASLFTDADSNGVVSPGDTLLYKVTFGNSGNTDATGVVFSDDPDINTTLVVGSVTTTKGVVTSGNNPGDTSIGINVGTLQGLGLEIVTVTFRVTINSPLSPTVTRVYNQGLISCNEVAPQSTDDPVTIPVGDPTGTDIAHPASVPAVPTLSQWGMIAMALLFCTAMVWLLRRKLTQFGPRLS
ncbi:MAG: IPTL-CTERM sorting domain-containing protein, partial [Chloroflexi bacterium]|nr:IPTL-CTERM sorting domain-containing protein [Chloroflexota bacterium]